MRLRLSLIITVSIFAISTLGTNVNGQIQGDGHSADDDTIIYRDCKIPYQLRALFIGSQSGTAFMLTAERYFGEQELRTLFSCLGRKYAEIPMMTITLFSDPEQLRVAIRSSVHDNDIHENPTVDTSFTDCKDPKSAVRPCPYGYFRARYFRFAEREHFEYSESPSKAKMTRITLQK